VSQAHIPHDAHNPHLVVTAKCAGPGCANVRRESNHWFLVTIEPDKFICRPYFPAQSLNAADQPACGQACAQKLLEQFLSGAVSCSRRPGSAGDRPSASTHHRQTDSTTDPKEGQMQFRELNLLQQEVSISERPAGPISGTDTISGISPGLVACVYIGLHCAHCGDVRQALNDFPTGDCTLCPECGAPSCFSRLGTGQTRRHLPFHEVPSSQRQAMNAIHEPHDIASRLRYWQEA